MPVDLNWFLSEEIDLLITAQNKTDVSVGEMKIRQRIATKNAAVLIRPEALAAFLYQAARKESLEVVDWTSYKLEVPKSTNDADRELKAKATFEWVKTLGLQFCPEFLAHVLNHASTVGGEPSKEEQVVASDPMTEWPGLELYLCRDRFNWNRVPQTLTRISKCIARKIAALHCQSEQAHKLEFRAPSTPRKTVAEELEDEEYSWRSDNDSSPLDRQQLDGQYENWGPIFGDGYHGLVDLMPLSIKETTKLHGHLKLLTQRLTSQTSSEDREESPSDSRESTADLKAETDASRDSDNCDSEPSEQHRAQVESEMARVIESFLLDHLCTRGAAKLFRSTRLEQREVDGTVAAATQSENRKGSDCSNEVKVNEGGATEPQASPVPPDEARAIQVPSLFNPNVSNLSVDLIADIEARRADVLQLENLATYVRKVALPRLVDHLVGSSDDAPLESGFISRLFHAFGLNMRYLGMVIAKVKKRIGRAQQRFVERIEDADGLANNTEEFPLLVESLERDLLARCVTYQFNRFLVHSTVGDLGEVTAYLFNLLICPLSLSVPIPKLDADGSQPQVLPTQQEFWAAVESRASEHFRYSSFSSAPSIYMNALHHRYPIIRTVCRKIGIQLTPEGVVKIMKGVADQTDLSNSSILGPLINSTFVSKENSHHQNSLQSNRKKGANGSPNEPNNKKAKEPKFEALCSDDIYGFNPVIKSEPCNPTVSNVTAATAIAAYLMDLFEVSFECHQQSVQILHQMNLPVSK